MKVSSGIRFWSALLLALSGSVVAAGEATAMLVQECKSLQAGQRPNGMLNCIRRDGSELAWQTLVEPGNRSVDATHSGIAYVASGARMNSRNDCAAHAQQSTMNNEQRQKFLEVCSVSMLPLADLERNARTWARADDGSRQREDAAYSPEQTRSANRNYCDSNNRSGTLAYDCACVLREVDLHMVAGKLSRRAIAQQQFDWSPCIDRQRSADKFVAANFASTTVQMYTKAGIDVESLKACHHRAIATDIPRESLSNAGQVRAELTQRCSARKR